MFDTSAEVSRISYITIIGFAALGFFTLAGMGIWLVIDKNMRETGHAARHDVLSGLPNRAAFSEALSQVLSRHEAMAVVFVDLDGFKAVNDTYGHMTGDMLIRRIADGFSSIVGKKALIARIGGDEFAILLTDAYPMKLSNSLVERMLSFVNQSFNLDGRVARVGASIGITIVEADEIIEGFEVMRRADVAMCCSKDAGGGRSSLFDPSLDTERAEGLSIASELREIVNQGRIEVACQPIVDAGSRKIIGVEALERVLS